MNPTHDRIDDDYFATALFLAATECWGEDDLDWLLREANAMGLLREVSPGRSGTFVLTARGVERLEAIAEGNPSSRQGFVAMWFDASTSDAYDHGIKPGIEDAGYEARRKKEHNNKIDDEIIAEIRRSRFVVADFACGTVPDDGKDVAIPRGGVYYEAGFAQDLNIPVIWTCREDQMDQVHFDTRQFSHILWTDPQDLRQKLRNKIGAVIGHGQ